MSPKKTKSQPKRSPRSEGAIRISKVYTRTGDAGMTRLVGGQEVKKSDVRIESYGTVDELGVWIGYAREALGLFSENAAPASGKAKSENRSALISEVQLAERHLAFIQNLLFSLGSELATRTEDHWEGMKKAQADDVKYLEDLIDRYNADLPPLKDFILAGGGSASLALHGCRVVARRAERVMQTLADTESLGEFALPFINRLSDFFFVLGRWIVDRQRGLGLEHPEIVWDHELKPPLLPGEIEGS